MQQTFLDLDTPKPKKAKAAKKARRERPKITDFPPPPMAEGPPICACGEVEGLTLTNVYVWASGWGCVYQTARCACCIGQGRGGGAARVRP